MVHVKDEGSYFEGSIQTVWRFMQSGEPHTRAHRSMRNRQAKPVGENVMEASMERNWKGNWVRVVNRITVLPPLGFAQEFLEGPLAGSKLFTLYTPAGARTRVDVVGEFVSPTLPPDDVEREARTWLEESYNEDAPAIRELQSSP
jgi:hypothetical protein